MKSRDDQYDRLNAIRYRNTELIAKMGNAEKDVEKFQTEISDQKKKIISCEDEKKRKD